MYDDDGERFHRYVPLLRRLVILVAILTAVPVILWTITASVRTYVAPPKTPTFRPLTATASIDAAASAPADAAPPVRQARASDPLPSPIIEAPATPADARDAAPAAGKGPLLGDRPPDGDAGKPLVIAPGSAPSRPPSSAPSSPPSSAPSASSAPAVATTRPDDADPQALPAPASDMAADETTPATGALAPQSPAAGEPSADATAASEPLAEPVPMPRRRPRYFAMVEVPMPRARPEAAGPSAAQVKAGPFDWLRKIFQPQQAQQ
jgi:hypothetical protein